MQKLSKANKRSTDLVNKIFEKIETPIVPYGFNFNDCELMSLIDKMSDDVRPKMLVNPGNPISEYKSNVLRFLTFCLGHVSANPSNPGNVAALRELYTFPRGDKYDDHYGKILNEKAFEGVNFSEKRVEQLAEELAELAQDNRDLYEKKIRSLVTSDQDLASAISNLSRRSKIYLLGKRGSGKTIFLNYLFSAKNYIFSNYDVIWFRIDLTKGNFNLQNWMRWQMCHILFKYYQDGYYNKGTKIDLDLTADNETLYNRIKHYADHFEFNASYKRKFNNFKTKVQTDVNVSETIQKSRTKQIKKIPESFFQGIWDYLALDKKVGIIFVVDGLDRLGLSEEDRKEFDKKFVGVQKYIMTTNAAPAAYIITMRFESYYHRVRDLRTIYSQLIMSDVNSWDIYLKRIDYIKSGKALAPRKLRNKKFSVLDNGLEILAAMMEVFLRYVTIGLTRDVKGKETSDPEKGMNILSDIFNKDRRKLFLGLQALLRFFFQNLIKDFEDEMLDALSDVNLGRVPNRLRKKYYLIIEGWMLNLHSYHMNQYEYRLSKNRKKIFSERGYGPSFIPNIYQHPVYEGLKVTSILVGTRILQLMKALEILDRKYIINYLVDHFNYDPLVIDRFINDMIHDGTLDITRPIRYKSLSRLKITARGQFVLDRLIGNAEYINLSIQTTDFPKILIDNNSFNMISAKNRTEFIFWKIKNSINFLRLVKQIENYERGIFNEFAQENKEIETYDNFERGCFTIFSKYKRNVCHALARILINAGRKGRINLITRIEDFIDKN